MDHLLGHPSNRYVCKKNGENLMHSPLYHLEFNELFEHAVQTRKNSLKKTISGQLSTTNLQKYLDNFLFTYRNSPSTFTGAIPSKMVSPINSEQRTLMQLMLTAYYQPISRN
jgi:hypothetical protein